MIPRPEHPNPQFERENWVNLNDIEQEVNGLYTYERKPKFDMNKIRKIITAKKEI